MSIIGKDGLTDYQRFTRKRASIGLCQRPACTKPPIDGRIFCQQHLDEAAGRQQKRISIARRLLQCTEAGCTNIVTYPKWYCDPCAEKRNERKHQRARTLTDIQVKRRNQTAAEYRRAETRRLREIVIRAYGGACACCGEDIHEFLTIDHVKGDGWREKNKYRRERWLRLIIERGFPDDYQILCFNCNCAKGNGTHCPHEDMVRRVLRIVS